MVVHALEKACYRIRRPRPRRYVDGQLGVEAFFLRLKELGIRYVALRWFEAFPSLPPGEDIDLLVADEDVPRIAPLFNGTKRSGIPCDVYSESGLRGTRFRKMAYYPVPLARQILEHAVWWKNVYRVPAPRYHLLSLAFHAAYHKGYDSGIPSAHRVDGPEQPEHEYARILRRLADTSGNPLPEPLTLESLDAYLGGQGWRPGIDTLEKLAPRNAWIRDAFFSSDSCEGVAEHLRGVGVFLVREKAEHRVSEIEQVLHKEGFDILWSEKIDPARRTEVSHGLRGGNWARGPWPVAGGLPAHGVVVLDLHPIPTDDTLARKHPGLTNGRMAWVKERIRTRINKPLPRNQRFNALHSSDNERQALEYLGCMFPDRLTRIEAKARAVHESFRTPHPVIRSLVQGRSRRAKVELVDFHGVPAVCKTFRLGRERFLQREIEARTIGKDLPAMSRILETGPHHVVLEWIEDHKQDYYRRTPPFGYPLLPLELLEEAKRILLYFRRRGYEYIDFSPKNLLVTKSGDIRVIDLEYLQKGAGTSDTLIGCLAWYPVPRDFEGDLPGGYRNKGGGFRRWRRAFGVPLAVTRREFPAAALGLIRMLFSVYLAQRAMWNTLRKPSRATPGVH